MTSRTAKSRTLLKQQSADGRKETEEKCNIISTKYLTRLVHIGKGC